MLLGILLAVLVAAAPGAQAQLVAPFVVNSPGVRPVGEPAPAAMAGLPLVASATPAQAAAQPVSDSVQDPFLAGKPCIYTPAIFNPFYIRSSEFYNYGFDITFACNDTRLTIAEQAACAKCISIRKREACLATISKTYFGVDKHSCTWVGPQGNEGQGVGQAWSQSSAGRTKEVRFSTGINVPWWYGMWLAPEKRLAVPTTCKIHIRLEVTSRISQEVFPTGQFGFFLNGWNYTTTPAPKYGILGAGLTPSLTCVLRQGQTVCEGIISRPAYLNRPFLVVRRDLWTDNTAAIAALKQDTDACFIGKNAAGNTIIKDYSTCPALPEPYKFEHLLRITEIPCKPADVAHPTAKVAVVNEYAFGERATRVYPGGAFTVNRGLMWELTGLSSVEWTVQVLNGEASFPTVPVVVGLLKYKDRPLCYRTATGSTIYSCTAEEQMASRALAGTFCTGKLCRGRFDFASLYGGPVPAGDGLMLIVSYAKFNLDATRVNTVLDPAVTPAQTVAVNYTGFP